ncbi:thioredoxin-disulfide reductase [Flavobacterium sp. HMWF030]|nr:thioredoxin-disulfide reductase [Flavobacterium sp. HMWF030]
MIQENEHVKCMIIGSGPAGYTAAIYAARADLKPVLYTGLTEGGQLTTTTDVENYPGYPDGIMGIEMMENFRKQAARFGTDIRNGYIVAVDFSAIPHKVTTDEGVTILCDSVIISTGASAKWLGLESEQTYSGRGVSACATCDGFFFKGQDVAIVGAGDTAAEEATHLAKLCRKVYMIVRKGELKASKAMIHKIKATPNIEILYHTETSEILGDESGVTGVSIFNNVSNTTATVDVSGFFVAIGHHPNTEIFKNWITMDNEGYIQTVSGSSKTNIPGVFCCGDAQDRIYRQAVTAAGSGCMAALDCERFLLGIVHESII